MNWEPKHFNFRICALNHYAIFSLIFEKYSQQKHVVSSKENLSNEDTCRNRIFFQKCVFHLYCQYVFNWQFPRGSKIYEHLCIIQIPHMFQVHHSYS